LDATSKSRNQVDELTASIRALREKVIDTKSIKETLADLVARSDILSGLAKNWAYGMDVAGTEFIIASNRIAAGMLIGKASFASNYLDWWKCYGHAYGGVPVQFGQATCAYEDFLGKIEEEVNKIVEKHFRRLSGRCMAGFLNSRSTSRPGSEGGLQRDPGAHQAAPDAPQLPILSTSWRGRNMRPRTS
jgi:hypothetical protein